MSCAKTAEPIEMPFGMWTQMGPWKHHQMGCILANTTERSMCGGDAAFLSNYFDDLLNSQTADH